MGVIKRAYKVEKQEETDILKGYKDVFTGTGCVPGLQHIHINRAVTLVVCPPTKVPLALQDKIKCELEGMEKNGVVGRQTEPTDWVNGMVTVQQLCKKINLH